MKLLASLIAMFFALTLNAQVNAEGRAILEKLYEVYGGKANIAAFSAMEQKGATFSVARNATVELERYYQFPLSLKITKTLQGNLAESRLVTTEGSWRDGKPVEGMLKDSMLLQAARMMVPKMLLEHENDLHYNGLLESSDGNSWHVFRVPVGETGSLMVQVEPKTFLIRATSGMITLEGGRMMKFITAYENFKSFGKLLFPTKEHHFAMQNYVGWSEIRDIRFENAIEPALFRP